MYSLLVIKRTYDNFHTIFIFAKKKLHHKKYEQNFALHVFPLSAVKRKVKETPKLATGCLWSIIQCDNTGTVKLWPWPMI